MRIIRANEYRRMPWKNGGGETVEIAVSPVGASLDTFDWRVSMAHVGSSGPFSRFPGVDRTLAVLAGSGIQLSVAGRGAVLLDRDTAPFVFSGDAPADAQLIDGPIDDLNVMTRRASHRHRLSRIAAAAAPACIRREGDLLLVTLRETTGVARHAGQEQALDADDTVLLDREDDPVLEIVPGAAAQLYAIDLWCV